MAISEAKKKSNKKWNDKNLAERYDRIQLVVPKGKKEQITTYAKEQGKSLNSFVNQAIDNEMQRDNTQGVITSVRIPHLQTFVQGTEHEQAKPQNAEMPKPKSFKKSAPYEQESDSEWLTRLNEDNPSYGAQEDTDDCELEEMPKDDEQPDEATIRRNKLVEEMKAQRAAQEYITNDDI